MMKKTLFFCAALVVLTTVAVYGVWYIALPEDYLVSTIESSVRPPVSLKIEGLTKSLHFTAVMDKVRVLEQGKEAAVLEKVTVALRPQKLVQGSAVFGIDSTLAGGIVQAEVVLTRPQPSVEGVFANIQIEQIAYLENVGLKGTGLLSGKFKSIAGVEEVEFTVRQCQLKNYTGNGIFLPLKYIDEIKGFLAGGQTSLAVKSLALSGKGIHARLTGTIINGMADMKVEIMPEKDFPGKAALFLMKNYEVSPGLYVIKIQSRVR